MSRKRILGVSEIENRMEKKRQIETMGVNWKNLFFFLSFKFVSEMETCVFKDFVYFFLCFSNFKAWIINRLRSWFKEIATKSFPEKEAKRTAWYVRILLHLLEEMFLKNSIWYHLKNGAPQIRRFVIDKSWRTSETAWFEKKKRIQKDVNSKKRWQHQQGHKYRSFTYFSGLICQFFWNKPVKRKKRV